MPIPITVFTGFLGSGKTTIIINIIKQLPKDYKVILLKNEFGNINTDSKLAELQNIKVQEMINGCLCCILVGKLQNALNEILDKYNPDHIFIETSGSAYPLPIVLEINKLKEKLILDGLINVIDAKNFNGYKDLSYIAKIQSEYTSLILINKHEGLEESKLDKVLDDIYELNPLALKVKTDKGYIDYKIVIGTNNKLFNLSNNHNVNTNHHNEIELMELIDSNNTFDYDLLINTINKLPKWDFFRIKGVVRTNKGNFLINYSFGDMNIINYDVNYNKTELSFFGKNFNYHYNILLKAFNINTNSFKLISH